MIRFASLVLLVLLLGQSLVKTFIYFDYLSDKEMITREFCINKSKPWLHCNGQCHLRKQLDKQDGNMPFSQKTGNERDERTEYIQHETVELNHSGDFCLELFFPESFFVSEAHTRNIFHPPTLIS